jgi:hypothetical protein
MTNALVESLKIFSVDAGVSITYAGGVVKADAKGLFVGVEQTAASASYHGIYNYYEVTGFGATYPAGMYNIVSLTATNAAHTGEIYGLVTGVEHNGSQTVASMMGLIISNGVMSTGSVTLAIGIKIGNTYDYGAGSVTTQRALHISGQTGATNNYAIWANEGWTSFNDSVIIRRSALATSATDGFLYITSSNGTPTGVPTTQTGAVPITVDYAADDIFIRGVTSSGWLRIRTVNSAVPASVTKTTGGAETGTVSGVQTMLDGSEYSVAETTGTPGFDIRFNFSSLTFTPTHIRLRLHYDGAAAGHAVYVALYNYNTTTFTEVHHIEETEGFILFDLPVNSWTNFVSGGAAIVQLYHSSAGNASHDIHFDYVGLHKY